MVWCGIIRAVSTRFPLHIAVADFPGGQNKHGVATVGKFRFNVDEPADVLVPAGTRGAKLESGLLRWPIPAFVMPAEPARLADYYQSDEPVSALDTRPAERPRI